MAQPEETLWTFFFTVMTVFSHRLSDGRCLSLVSAGQTQRPGKTRGSSLLPSHGGSWSQWRDCSLIVSYWCCNHLGSPPERQSQYYLCIYPTYYLGCSKFGSFSPFKRHSWPKLKCKTFEDGQINCFTLLYKTEDIESIPARFVSLLNGWVKLSFLELTAL